MRRHQGSDGKEKCREDVWGEREGHTAGKLARQAERVDRGRSAEEAGSSRDVGPGDMHLPAKQQEPDQALVEELVGADPGKRDNQGKKKPERMNPRMPATALLEPVVQVVEAVKARRLAEQPLAIVADLVLDLALLPRRLRRAAMPPGSTNKCPHISRNRALNLRVRPAKMTSTIVFMLS